MLANAECQWHISRLTHRFREQARTQLDLCVPGTDEEISDMGLGLPLGTPLPSLRTPLQTQRTGVAARIT